MKARIVVLSILRTPSLFFATLPTTRKKFLNISLSKLNGFSCIKNRIVLWLILIWSLLSGISCKKDGPADFCSDNIQNNGETGIDCGGNCTACLDFDYSLPFFLQYRENGAYTIFQTDTPGYSNNVTISEALWGLSKPTTTFNLDPGLSVDVTLEFTRHVTDLEGTMCDYTSASAFIFDFYINSQAEKFSLGYCPNQSGSKCYIESITLLSSYPVYTLTANIYAVRGNFNCKISNLSGSDVKFLNDGKFSVMVIEYD